MTHDNNMLHSECGNSVCKTGLTGEWVYFMSYKIDDNLTQEVNLRSGIGAQELVCNVPLCEQHSERRVENYGLGHTRV